MLVHLFYFIAALAGIWISSGLLVSVTDRISTRFGKGKFFVAFVVLGILTSLSELSVAINGTLQGVPDTSVGNLLGASIVILLFVAPFLALCGNGIRMDRDGSFFHLLPSLLVTFFPAPFLIDGVLSAKEGMIFICAYILLLGHIYFADRSAKQIRPKVVKTALWRDVGTLGIAAVVIFFAGKGLVAESHYFSESFGVSASIIGLLLLSVGTNIPEISVGARSIFGKKKTVAFGDYIGSAAFNTAILGALALANGRIEFDPQAFYGAAVALGVGLSFFYILARTKKILSRKEALVLIAIYIMFLVWEVIRAA